MVISLVDLPRGVLATVVALKSAVGLEPAMIRRLSELGFLPGEAVQILQRGPGGREPLAVQIGETMFALRKLEASCIMVSPA